MDKKEANKVIDDILDEYKTKKKFPFYKTSLLTQIIPFVEEIPKIKRKKVMEILSGQLLQLLDTNEDEDTISNTNENVVLNDEIIPILFEYRYIISKIYEDCMEVQYTLKQINREISRNINISFDKDKAFFLNQFFDKLEYPYTKANLRKCKLKIIKENHPDNGGDGNYIKITQEIYNIFLNHIQK